MGTDSNLSNPLLREPEEKSPVMEIRGDKSEIRKPWVKEAESGARLKGMKKMKKTRLMGPW